MSSTRKPTILAVDDLQDNLDLIRQMFEDEPYEIITAGSAEAALALVEHRRPDLAILDVLMPETDGFELCNRLREGFADNPVPIIFLTAVCTSTENTVHGLDIGACDYLIKPIDADELRARVRAVIRCEAEHEQQTNRAKRIVRRLVKP